MGSLNEKLLHYSDEIFVDNSFDTPRGHYRIRIIKYKNELYFHKMKNGTIVEIQNLSKMKNEVKSNG